MYVIPFLMGPKGSPFSKVGVELTDSLYVVLNMGMMTRMGKVALEHLGSSDDFTRGLHARADLNENRRFICHFPQDNTIWSVGSGYGGNALLSKKCMALRLASALGRKEGWLAEHMLILGIESPEGEKSPTSAAPSRAPAARPTWRCSSRPRPQVQGLEGLDRRRRHRLARVRARTAGSTPSTRRPASSASPPAPAAGPIRTPSRCLQKDAIFTNVADEAGRHRLVGGAGRAAAAECTDWTGKSVDPRQRQPRRPTPTAASPLRVTAEPELLGR